MVKWWKESYAEINSTYCGWVSQICVSELGYRWLRYWLAFWVPSHYLKRWWLIIDRAHMEKFQSTLFKVKQFHSRNAFEYIVCRLSAIWLSPQYVNPLWLCDSIWRHGSGSTLTKDRLTAQSHYLNKCRIHHDEVMCRLPRYNFTTGVQATEPFDIMSMKIRKVNF